MSPTSSTRLTLSAPVTITAIVGMANATRAETLANRVRASTTSSPAAARPVASDGRLISPGLVSTSRALARAMDPDASTPVRSGIWPRTMFTATPARKPFITEYETKRV